MPFTEVLGAEVLTGSSRVSFTELRASGKNVLIRKPRPEELIPPSIREGLESADVDREVDGSIREQLLGGSTDSLLAVLAAIGS